MLYDRNFFDGRLHALGNFDYPFERRIAGHHPFEKIAEDPFDLAVDQIIDLEFVQTVCALQLPRTWSADNNLRLVLCYYRMRDDLEKLGGVDGNQVLTGDLRIDISGVRNPERVVRVNRDYFSFRTNKLFQVFEIANDHVVFRVFAEQQSLNHSQAIGNILGTSIGPRLVDQSSGIDPLMAVLGGNGCRKHLLQNAVLPLARLARRCGQNDLW